MANKPDIYRIQNYSKGNCTQSELISRKWNIIAQNRNEKPPLYLFLLYGHYEFLLNDSLLRAEEVIERYNKIRGWKREDHDKRGTTRDDHLYDCEDNFSVTIRTESEKVGVVVDCSKSIEKALGHKRNNIIGLNIGIIMSPFIADRHNAFIQDYIKTGQSSFLGNLQSIFVKNRSGFLQKYSVLANIHPYLNKEVYLTGLFRLDRIQHEYMLITPYGEIDSCTETIASVLGIANKKIHINSICPNLIRNHEPTLDQNDLDPSSEDLLYSTQRLLRSNRKRSTHLISYKSVKRQSVIDSPLFGDINEEQGNVSALRFPDELELEFYPLSTPSNSPLFYHCKISKVPVKDAFLVILELQMLDKKMGRRGSKTKNHKQEANIKMISPEVSSNTENRFILTGNQIESSAIKSDFLGLKDVSATHKSFNVSKQHPEKKFIKQSQQIVVSRTSSSSGSLSTAEKNIQTNIEQVSRAEYSSTKARALLLGVFIIFIALVAVQTELWISTNRSLKNVKALTTTLDLANSRADTFAYLDRFTMACKFIEEGLIAKNSPLASIILQSYSSLYRTMIPSLKTSNYRLMEAVRDIDASFQDYFKAETIRMYDINLDLTRGSYQKFDTFTAINLLIQKYLKLSGSLSNGSFLGSVDLAYILTNSMNDLLLETVNAVEVILKEAELSIENSLKTFKSYKIVYLILIIAMLGLILYLSVWTYSSEMTLVQHCLGFSNEAVQIIRDRLTRFEETLVIEDANELYGSYQVNRYSYKKMENSHENSKTVKYFKSPTTKTVQVQFIKKVGIFILLLVAYGTIAFFAFQEIVSRIQTLGVRMKRLAKVQSISYENSIMYLTLEKIAVQDSDNSVKNRPAEEELGLSLEGFLNDVSNLIDLFKTEDGSVDPKVASLFLNNACEYISAAYKYLCLDAKKDSNVFGLVAILGRQYSIAKDIFDTFNSSNKSITFQRKMAMDIMMTLGPNSYILRELLNTLVELARNEYSAQSDMTNLALGWSTGIGILLSCVMCLFTWRFVILYHMQFLKRFRRKLKLIPIYLVLQNPVLKGVLINLARGKLII